MSNEARWNGIARKMLIGRKVVEARYMTKQEAEQLGWDKQPVVIFLDNGLQLYPSMDDEGNNAGAMFTSDEKTPGLPVLG